jgi:hypothetical protein
MATRLETGDIPCDFSVHCFLTPGAARHKGVSAYTIWVDRPIGSDGARPGAVLRRRPEAPLELSDEALEFADPLPEGGVLGEEPGQRGGCLLVAPRPPGRDAAARGADALRPAARQGTAADRAQTGL